MQKTEVRRRMEVFYMMRYLQDSRQKQEYFAHVIPVGLQILFKFAFSGNFTDVFSNYYFLVHWICYLALVEQCYNFSLVLDVKRPS